MSTQKYQIACVFFIFCFLAAYRLFQTLIVSNPLMTKDIIINRSDHISMQNTHDNPAVFIYVNESRFFAGVTCGSFETEISGTFSFLKLQSFTKKNITVTVFAYNNKNLSKTSGGDMIAIWAQQLNGGGRVSGRVSDNQNGSYTATIPLFWNGLIQIRAKILSTSENTCLRYKALTKYGNVMYSHPQVQDVFGHFQKFSLKEKTVCRPDADVYGYQNICNFTKLNGNSPWYCGSPSKANLTCNDLDFFGSKVVDITTGYKEKIKHHGHSDINSTLKVDIKEHVNKIPSTRCRDLPKDYTWTRNYTSGYFASAWRPTYCSGPRNHSVQSYRQCLNGKYVVMMGDSTVYQYFQYFCIGVLNISCNSIYKEQAALARFDRVKKAYNVSFLFKSHELPNFNPYIKPSWIKSYPSVLKDLADGPIPDESLIVFMTYYAHLTAFSTSGYRSRLSNLVQSIKYLLAKKPKAVILYKGPHVILSNEEGNNKWFDPKFALLFRDILFEEFRDIMDRVIYLDLWDVTVTHGSETLHPGGTAFGSQIQQFMAFIC